MKTLIKTTIGIMALAIGGVSVASADNYRQQREFDKPRYEKHYRDNQRQYQHQWKHDDRHSSRYQNDRRVIVKQHPHWKQAPRYVEKHVYSHGRYAPPRRVVKKVIIHDRYAPPPRVVKKVIIRDRYAPPPRVVEKVIIQDRHAHRSALPIVAGTLIGSAIGHDIGNGDPISTFGGAIFGAMIGDAVSRH